MRRRVFLALGTGVAVSVLTGFKPVSTSIDNPIEGPFLAVDLEPDGLAKTYRKYRLLIIAQRDDRRAIELAQVVVDVLARYLPESRSKLIRAADARRVGVLIGTRQQDIAVMSRESASALFQTAPPFSDIRNVPLRVIALFGTYCLVCRTDFPDRHAYLLARTLSDHKTLLPTSSPEPTDNVPLHEGSRAYYAGEGMPLD